MVYVVACIAAIAGLLFGYHEGIIAGALPSLKAEFNVSPGEEGLMMATIPLGGLAGAIIAGSLAAPWGRRNLLVGAALLFILSALGCGLAQHIPMLAAGRFCVGVSIGVATMIAPLYIAEMAPASRRGMLVSIFQLAITLGILAAYVVGYIFENTWRVILASAMVPGVLLLVGAWRLTETPRWLVLSGRRTEAATVISRLRRCGPKDPEVQRVISSIDYAVHTEDLTGSWGDLFTPMVRPALVVGMGLFFFQQLSGINAIIYYAPTVFASAGFEHPSRELMATIGIGVVNVLMTLVAMALIDRIGRRRLLLIGFGGTALSLVFIAIAEGTGMPELRWLSFIGLALYVGSFAVAIGPLPWVMMSEIFPLGLRGPGLSLVSITNWTFNFLVVFTFPGLLAQIGLGAVFAIYAVVCTLGLIFTIFCVPETSRLTLEEIEAHLAAGRPFRALAPA